MQNYSEPFLQSSIINTTNGSTIGDGSGGELYPASGSSGPRTTTPKSSDIEGGLDWSGRISNQVNTQKQHQHQLQRARAANTLSSLSHTRDQEGAIAPSTTERSTLNDNTPRDFNRKRPKSMQGPTDRRHGQISRAHGLGSSRTNTSIFIHGQEDEEDDELGGGGSSKYPNNNDATKRPQSQPFPSGRAWDSGEAKEVVSSGTRKQNSACDACRNRKVRCNRILGEEKCAHCKTKGIGCTTVFVQLATTGNKRLGKRTRQSTEGAVENSNSSTTQSEGSTSTLIRYLIFRDAEYPTGVRGPSYTPFSNEEHRVHPFTTAESRLHNASIRIEFVSDLIETYFSIVHTRYPILDPQEFRKRFHNPSTTNGGPPADVLVAVILAWGAKFSENPIIVADRREAANQLTPTQKKERETATTTDSTAYVATAAPVQGGAQEREREKKRRERSRTIGDEFRVIGRSRIAEDLVIKAQEVLDRNKVHRISSLDNIRAALIVEALFWRPSHDSVGGKDELGTNSGIRKRRGLYVCDGAWVSSAIWHLKELRVHEQETIERIKNPAQRPQVAMCWWLACQMDAHMSAFYRRKPYLALEDYTTDLPAPPPAPEQEGPHPLASEQGYQIWLTSSQQQVEMMRSVYYTLWDPQTAIHGLSARKLEKLASLAFAWRENHLALVGAPSPTWPSHWNFSDAVTACSSDMNYHIVWILIWEAIEEFGIAELKATNTTAYTEVGIHYGGSPTIIKTKGEMELDQSKIRGLSSRIYNEALNGALRCANLSQVLCDNGYLRLEAGIIKWTMAEAGFCLTKFKRPEVTSIIEALRQYGQAFEECYDQANELEQLANDYMHNDTELTSSSSSLYFGGGGATTKSSSSQFSPASGSLRYQNEALSHSNTPQLQSQQASTFAYYSSSPSTVYNRGSQNGPYLNNYGQPLSYQQQQQQQQSANVPAFISNRVAHQSTSFY